VVEVGVGLAGDGVVDFHDIGYALCVAAVFVVGYVFGCYCEGFWGAAEHDCDGGWW
jgi:hypothetical protein